MQLPEPDPALKRLDRFVGTWSMEGNLVGSNEKNIKGQSTFRWLPGGFFMEQLFEMDFMGMKIHSQELIAYDPETGTFPSTVYSNVSPAPLPYRWEVGDDGSVKITVKYGRWTRRSREAGTRTGPSPVAGVPTPARTRP